jgi:hypothetical protein
MAHVDHFEQLLAREFEGADRPMAPTLFPDYRRKDS